MLTIPCDYSQYNSRQCENGQVLIYGDMPVPPQIITCPKCNGTGEIQVEESVIEKQIADLIEDRKEINQEIRRLRRYLK